MNKKAESSIRGFFTGIFVIVLGLIFFIAMNFAFQNYIRPGIGTTINTSIGNYGFEAADAEVLYDEFEIINRFWISVPIIIGAWSLLYWIINAFRNKERFA